MTNISQLADLAEISVSIVVGLAGAAIAIGIVSGLAAILYRISGRKEDRK